MSIELYNPSSGGTPGGSDKQIQFNDGGAFGGDARFTIDKTLGQYLLSSISPPGDPNSILGTDGATSYVYGKNNVGTLWIQSDSDGASGAYSGGFDDAMGAILTIAPTGNISTDQSGIFLQVRAVVPAGVTHSGTMYGGQFYAGCDGSAGAATTVIALATIPFFLNGTGTGTVATSIGLACKTPTIGGVYVITNNYGIKIEPQQGIGSTFNAALAIDSQGSGANDYAIYSAGGKVLLGNWALSAAGVVTTYKSIPTANSGHPVLVAGPAKLTAQSGARSAQLVFATGGTPGAGLYRISYVATITTVDGVASVLGGASGFQVIFVNANGDAVTKTSNPTTPNISAVDATGTTISGCVLGYAAASTNINYNFGYTSTGGNMRYDLVIYVEYLG